jgi:hypothetical protein
MSHRGTGLTEAQVLPTRRKSDAGELPESAKRCPRGIEAEAEVFFCVVFVFVGGFMMVRV